MLGYLSHVDTVLADAEDWTHDPWSGAIHDGFLWGRGALDMKSQTAAEAVAAARLARDGWRPARGALKVFSVVDEETGGIKGAKWLCENRPDLARADYLLNEGAGTVMPFGDRRLHGVCCAEKGTFRFAVRARGRAGHASVPATADNALLKLAPALERLGSRRPPYDVTDEPRAFLRAIGDDPDDPEGAVERIRAVDPRLAALFEPTLGVTVAPTIISAGEKINVIPARAELLVDCRVPPGMGAEATMARIQALLDGVEDVEVEFIEQVVGNRSAIETPLMDAIRDWVGAGGDGAEAVPVMLPGVHRLAPLARRLPRLRRLRLLPPAPPDALRDLAADPLRRRAHRRARPRRRRVVLPRAAQEASLMSPVTEGKLRLGGMALRNGLLVHGPTHWAAAVRDKQGEHPGRLRPQAARAGRRRRPGRARRRAPRRGVRGDPARQARDARRQAPVREPGRDRRRGRGVARRRPAAPAHARRGRRGRRRADLARARPCSRCAAASWPSTTASSTRRSPPTRRPTTRPTRPTPTRSTTAAARTWSRRCSPPTSPARCCCAGRRAPGAARGQRRRARLDRRGRRGLRLVRAQQRVAHRAGDPPPRLRDPARGRHARAGRAPARGRARRARGDPARRAGSRCG